jgi:hypothetical protein
LETTPVYISASGWKHGRFHLAASDPLAHTRENRALSLIFSLLPGKLTLASNGRRRPAGSAPHPGEKRGFATLAKGNCHGKSTEFPGLAS